MPLTGYLPSTISYKDADFPLNSWSNEVVRRVDGYYESTTFGLAQISSTPQFAIPLIIPSNRKRQSAMPDRPMILPQGAIITFAGFRLPRFSPASGGGDFYGNLPTGCNIVGVTGENLKLSPTTGNTHTVTAPAIAAVSNAFSPDASAKISRAYGAADAASPSLLTTLSAATTFQISVSNSGNTAAGTGISLSQSGAIAFIVAQISWIVDGDVLRLEDIGYPLRPD
jgi:hypothetical protein